MPLLSFAVKFARGHLFHVVDGHTPIGTLKDMLAPRFHIPREMALMTTHTSRVLSDDELVRTYIKNGDDCFHLKLRPTRAFEDDMPEGFRGNAVGVYIYMPDGSPIALPVFSDHTFKYVIDTALKTAGVRIGYFGHYSIYHNGKQLKSSKTLRDYNLLHGGQVFEIMAIDEEEDRGQPPSNGLTNAKIEVWNFTSGYSFKDIQCFQVCYIERLPHVQTSYGCYEVDNDFLMHNNILFMSETDSDEDKEDDEKEEEEEGKEEDMPDTATCPVDVPEPQVASIQDVATAVVEQNEPHNIFGEEMTFVVRVWDLRDGSEDDVVGSTVITIEIERCGKTLCADLVGKLREDGYITTDDFDAIVFMKLPPWWALMP